MHWDLTKGNTNGGIGTYSVNNDGVGGPNPVLTGRYATGPEIVPSSMGWVFGRDNVASFPVTPTLQMESTFAVGMWVYVYDT